MLTAKPARLVGWEYNSHLMQWEYNSYIFEPAEEGAWEPDPDSKICHGFIVEEVILKDGIHNIPAFQQVVKAQFGWPLPRKAFRL